MVGSIIDGPGVHASFCAAMCFYGAGMPEWSLGFLPRTAGHTSNSSSYIHSNLLLAPFSIPSILSLHPSKYFHSIQGWDVEGRSRGTLGFSVSPLHQNDSRTELGSQIKPGITWTERWNPSSAVDWPSSPTKTHLHHFVFFIPPRIVQRSMISVLYDG